MVGLHFSYPNVFHTLVQVATDICVEKSSYDKHDHEDIHQQPENQERPHHSTVNKRKSVLHKLCYLKFENFFFHAESIVKFEGIGKKL